MSHQLFRSTFDVIKFSLTCNTIFWNNQMDIIMASQVPGICIWHPSVLELHEWILGHCFKLPRRKIRYQDMFKGLYSFVKNLRIDFITKAKRELCWENDIFPWEIKFLRQFYVAKIEIPEYENRILYWFFSLCSLI